MYIYIHIYIYAGVESAGVSAKIATFETMMSVAVHL